MPSKGSARDAALNDIREALVTAPLLFTVEVSDGYERLAAQVDLGQSAPTFKRFAVRDGVSSSFSHLDQEVLLVEGFAFFHHHLNRLAFRRGDERLRDALAPVITASVKAVVEMLAALHPTRHGMHDAVLERLNLREDQYALGRRTWGEDPADETTALGMAGKTIAIALAKPHPDPDGVPLMIRVVLMEQMLGHPWSDAIKKLENSLTPLRAASSSAAHATSATNPSRRARTITSPMQKRRTAGNSAVPTLAERAPRWVPFVHAIIELGIAAALLLLWHPHAGGILYWVRGIIFAFFALPGSFSLWLALFGSDKRVNDAFD